jgi:hypothetical protein
MSSALLANRVVLAFWVTNFDRVAMKAVIQRVLNAAVTVDGEVVGSISKGLCVLVGIATTDADEDMEYMY